MKKMNLLLGLFSCLIMACTVPSETDFQSLTKPLSEDELITAWRFPMKWNQKESLIKMGDEEKITAMNKVMQPIASQVIPQIFKDAKEGRLIIYENKTPEDLEAVPISDLIQRMNSDRFFRANWDNISPFQKAIHIVQRRKNDQIGFLAEELKLEIIGADPEGKSHEKYFGFVFISDLVQLGYKVKLEEKRYDLLSYFDHIHTYAYPIFYRNYQMTQGLQSLEEAFGTKEYLLKGEWEKIDWLDGRPNLTGYHFQSLSSELLDKFAGNYKLRHGEEIMYVDGIQAEIEITREGERLKVLWPVKSPYFATSYIYSVDKTHFFDLTGEQIKFIEIPGQQMQCQITHENSYIVIGTKYK